MQGAAFWAGCVRIRSTQITQITGRRALTLRNYDHFIETLHVRAPMSPKRSKKGLFSKKT